MNWRAIFKIISPVLSTIGFVMLGCVSLAYYYHEDPRPLLLGALISLVLGLTLWVGNKSANINAVNIVGGAAVVTFAWVLSCLVGAVPFFIYGLLDPTHVVTITQAIYETVSGFTTTGASIYADVELLPRSLLFWRSLTHWFGGMGIVVFAIAILPRLGLGGLQAFRMESPGPLKTDKLVPRISQTAKILYTVYFGVTVIEIILLSLVGVSWFDSMIHTFGTVGTGGFSNYNNSVAGLHNVYAEFIIAFFMWLSGANFGLLYLVVWKRELRALWRDAEFKVYTSITILAIVLITGILYYKDFFQGSPSAAFRYAMFQVPTILTTTGFASYDYIGWPVAALMVLVVLMFIGSSTGSTGGGLKVLRFQIAWQFIKHEVLKIIKPNLVTTVKVGGRAIHDKIVSSVLALILIYLATFAAGTFILTFYNLDIVTAFTASIANLGNIGPGLGMVGPAGNYSALPTGALWVLIIEMLVGRLEIYTVLVLFNAALWRKRG